MLKGKSISQTVMTYGIKHVDELRYILILCVIFFFAILIMIWVTFFNECAVLCLGALMLSVVILYGIYQPAIRYSEIMNSLESNLLDMEWVQANTLKFTTTNLGEFYLRYVPETDNQAAHYIVWITCDKGGPSPMVSRMILWKKPYKSILGKWLYFDSPPYVPVFKVNEITTLQWIGLECFGNENRIMARLSDRWLNSETEDLIKAVEVLEEVYARM